jgi:hypothetical protein
MNFRSLRDLALRLTTALRGRTVLTAADGRPFFIGRSVRVPPSAKIGGWSYLQAFAYVGRGAEIGRYCAIARFAEIGPVHHDTEALANHEFMMHRNRFPDDSRPAPGNGEGGPPSRVRSSVRTFGSGRTPSFCEGSGSDPAR